MQFKSILIISSFVVLFGACKEKAPRITDENNGDTVTYFKNDDEAMNKAIETAQKTFDQFEAAFAESNSGKYKESDTPSLYSDFSIKVGFPTKDNGKEHMWVGDIQFDGKNYMGILLNYPAEDVDFKYGDKITIEKSLISDWKFVDSQSNRTIGGYTIQVMRDEMSDEERLAFDQSTDFAYAK